MDINKNDIIHKKEVQQIIDDQTNIDNVKLLQILKNIIIYQN